MIRRPPMGTRGAVARGGRTIGDMGSSTGIAGNGSHPGTCPPVAGTVVDDRGFMLCG